MWVDESGASPNLGLRAEDRASESAGEVGDVETLLGTDHRDAQLLRRKPLPAGAGVSWVRLRASWRIGSRHGSSPRRMRRMGVHLGDVPWGPFMKGVG